MGLAALEMEPTEEEEFRSLIITNGRTSKALHGNDGTTSSSMAPPSFLRPPKEMIVLLTAAALVLILVFKMDRAVLYTPTNRTSEGITQKQQNPHSGNSFGGIKNVAHPAGAKAAMETGKEELYKDIVIPKSNVGHAIPSLNAANVINLLGHYEHDEFRSPYASHLYDKPKEELDRQQRLFEEKMKKVRVEWGAWSFRDPQAVKDRLDSDQDIDRPIADFSGIDYKDLRQDDFPQYAWQADEEYVTAFLKEARALVDRMTEGIFAEYGWPKKKSDGKLMTEGELKQRDEAFKIHILDGETNQKENKGKGVAQLSQQAMDGLVRKLLHAMMTNDEFYVVLAGHSAAAGHGNDFQQNRMLTFHRIMEPVFDKLGMKLMSRNMGMGGVGTLQFTLGGGDFYGETDIIEWDSGMTEKGPAVDLFNKQAILSGERVPIIFNEYHFNIMAETNGTAWMGKAIWDLSMMPETTLENQETIPYAARWISQKEEKYNAICWEPRSDFTPDTNQKDHPGSQVGWHPGFRHHQWSGRKLALIVLKALSLALDVWEEGTKKDGYPLADHYWHVGVAYREIREKLRMHITTPKENDNGEDIRSDCEKMIKWLPRICRVQLHGFGLWTPQTHIDYNLLNIIKPAMNGYKPYFKQKNLYNGFDLLPYKQAIPEGQVDVHAIAIATTYPAPDLDHSWIEDHEDTQTQNGNATTRRMLREGTALAFWAAASVDADRSGVDQLERNPRSRHLDSNSTSSSAVIPGRGWELHGWTVVDGFCDGSAQSECRRGPGEQCLLYGANDNHLDVTGNALAGWLVFQLPKVREGIILARMEWWCGTNKGTSLTQDWNEVDDGKTFDTTRLDPKDVDSGSQRQRILGKPTIDDMIPSDLQMDIAINGKIVHTMDREEFIKHTAEYVKNVAVFPLLNDESMAIRDWDGEPMEVAIRFRSKKSPQQTYCLSHLYYA